jgi:membrane associated rhomboid family serine protease
MLFIPFKVDLALHRFPLLTMLVCIACIVIFMQQQANFAAIEQSVVYYCNSQAEDSHLGLVLEKVHGERSLGACANIIYSLFTSKQRDKDLDTLADEAERIEAFPADYSRQFIREKLSATYAGFEKQNTAHDLTQKLMYAPDSFKITNMISAAFAHGSWSHVIGNLFFFFAFAAAIELALGLVAYSLIFVSLAIATHLAYSLSLLNVPDALPTLGLSGVVMGMIGLFAFLMPTVKIRCLWWFIFFFRILRVPAWILAAWYVGWDIYDLNHSANQSNINFVAHVSGAAIGFVLGFAFFRQRKAEIRAELMEHSETREYSRVLNKS